MRAEIHTQIKNITKLLVEAGISVYQKYPQWNEHSLIWEGFKNVSFALQKEKYQVIYDECLKEKDFNILMLDGALIQFMYKFYKEEVVEHILAFYPNPDIERYQDNPELYEELYYGQQLFTEVLDEKIVCSPLRFDFNVSAEIHKDVDHPKSHLTIGNYSACRIPIQAPVTPYRFIKFILRNFYNNKFLEHFDDATFQCPHNVNSTITENEKRQIHFGWVHH